MNYITREQWGARKPRYTNRAAMSAEPTGHWNGPKITINGQTTWHHDKCFSLIRGIQNFHMDGQGWSDIAYNFMICPHGFVFQGRGLKITNGANGTNSGNQSSHAVMCLAGEGNPFTQVEKKAYKDCIAYIAHNSLAPNSSKGHRDHKSTACPGDERYDWVHAGMPLDEGPAPQPIEDDDMILIVNLTDPNNAKSGTHQYAVSGVKGRWIQRDADRLELIKRFGAKDETALGTTSSLMFFLENGPLMTPRTVDGSPEA